MTQGKRLRARLLATPFAEPVDLRGKHFIVTGASPGSIGFATAQTLASWGARVAISTRRNTAAAVAALRERLPPAHAASVSGHPLELAERSSVGDFASWYLRAHGARLDVLINNAGIHLDLRSQWTEPRLEDGYEIHWRTNTLGTLQLTEQLRPPLMQTAQSTGDARIVFVVSELHRRARNAELFAPRGPYNSWAAYGASKLALMHASFELQRRYGACHVQTACLHPGAVYTHIADRGLEGSRFIAASRRLLAPLEAQLLLTPEEGAQTSLHCATSPHFRGGHYYRACRLAQPDSAVLDSEVGARLWEQVRDWIEAAPPATDWARRGIAAPAD